MRLIDYFERAYVINLPERTDRKADMTRELDRADMPFGQGKVEWFTGIRPDSAAGFDSVGTRGCFLSHLGVLQKAQAAGLRNVLVMEDDLELADDFRERENAVVEELQRTDWDIVQLGYLSGVSDSNGSENGTLRPMSGTVVGLQLYAVNGKSLDRAVEFLESLLRRPPGHQDGGPMYPDGALNFLRMKQPDVRRFIAVPSLAGQRSSRSDVNTKWFDRVPVVGSLASAARRLKNRAQART